MMRALMHDSISKRKHTLNRHLLGCQISIPKSNQTWILHCTHLVFMGEDLIVFGEGVWIGELLLEVEHAFNRYLEDEFFIILKVGSV